MQACARNEQGCEGVPITSHLCPQGCEGLLPSSLPFRGRPQRLQVRTHISPARLPSRPERHLQVAPHPPIVAVETVFPSLPRWWVLVLRRARRRAGTHTRHPPMWTSSHELLPHCSALVQSLATDPCNCRKFQPPEAQIPVTVANSSLQRGGSLGPKPNQGNCTLPSGPLQIPV